MSFSFRNLLPHITALILFILVSCIYFAPQFSGKVIQQGDILSYRAAAQESKEYRKKGDNILWTNSMFAGMPNFQIATQTKGNLTRVIQKILVFLPRPAGYFIGACIIFFIALLLFDVNAWLAMVGAIAYGFTTNSMVLYEAGHATKFVSLMYGALILAGIYRIIRKKYTTGFLAFGIGLSLNINANHYQMTYYIGLIAALMVIVFIINASKNKDFKHLGLSLALFTVGSLLAIGASASRFWTTYEYSKSTMRSKPILEKDNSTASSAKSEGLDWNYSMQWSNSALDLVAGYIPGVVGGGSSEPISKNSHTNKFLRRKGAQPLEQGPMYWGKLPFTSGPVYFGAAIVFLFLFSVFSWKSSLKWWGLAAVILTILLSMGKELEWFNRLFFDYMPFYNKFRTPNSIGGVTAIAMIITAMLGTNVFIKDVLAKRNLDNYLKPLLISGGILIVISLFFILFGNTFFDFTSGSDARYAQSGFDTSVFEKDRAHIMIRDSMRSLIIVLISMGLIYFVVKKKLNPYIMMGSLALITLIDIIGVDLRYVNNDNFVNKRNDKTYFNERPVDKKIKQDTDPHYRVFDLSRGNPFNNAWSSYHHKSIGGYHAAKLQRIQDAYEHSISNGEEVFLNLLNAKYIITGEPGKEQAAKNPNALGNAWFVKNYIIANTNRDELNSVKEIDVKNTAVIHHEFDQLPDVQNLGNGTISLTSYHPDEMNYISNNPKEGLVIFSEMWYGPNKGWKIYVDGVETSLIRANYLLRAALIPPGKHEIKLKFHPKSFYVGEIISYIASSLLLILLILAAVYSYRDYRNKRID